MLSDPSHSYLAVCIWFNQSCNCNSPKLIMLDSSWTQAQEFVDAVCNELSQLPPRPSYYPGSQQRHAAFAAAYPSARVLQPTSSSSAASSTPPVTPTGYLPWIVAELDEDSAAKQPHALQVEAFAPCVAFMRIKGNMLDDGVTFANQRLMGTLSCSVIISTADSHSRSEELEGALARLRYGLIGLNCWSAAGYMFPTATWGAFPGESLAAVSSGIGIVRNYLMFKHPSKTVVRAPFISEGHFGTSPTPMDLAQARTIVSLSTQLFFVTNAVPRAVKTAWNALKSLF